MSYHDDFDNDAKIYVGNIDYNLREDQIWYYFNKFGEIHNMIFKEGKGFGFI